MIPVLMITHNRLEYSKQALEALNACKGVEIYVIDNGSTDGTVDWLKDGPWHILKNTLFNSLNIGIAGAMNQFLQATRISKWVGKVDNDTIIPSDFLMRMIPHLSKADIVQAKHPLIKASGVGTFDEWVSGMPADGPLRFNHFVGGSGIVFKRRIVDRIPTTDNKIMGWRQWQKDHPEVKKAFATDVEIKLLDTTEDGTDYSKYPEYYQQTGRL